MLFGHISYSDNLYLIGVWLGEDPRTNSINIHVSKRLVYVFKILLATPHSIVNTIGRTYVLGEEINRHVFPIIVTK